MTKERFSPEQDSSGSSAILTEQDLARLDAEQTRKLLGHSNYTVDSLLASPAVGVKEGLSEEMDKDLKKISQSIEDHVARGLARYRQNR